MLVDEENRLEIRDVDVLRADAEYAYLGGGAIAGERICLTTIASPVNGMLVRTTSQSASVESEAEVAGADRS